jgi:hypothetical protein
MILAIPLVEGEAPAEPLVSEPHPQPPFPAREGGNSPFPVGEVESSEKIFPHPRPKMLDNRVEV